MSGKCGIPHSVLADQILARAGQSRKAKLYIPWESFTAFCWGLVRSFGFRDAIKKAFNDSSLAYSGYSGARGSEVTMVAWGVGGGMGLHRYITRCCIYCFPFFSLSPSPFSQLTSAYRTSTDSCGWTEKIPMNILASCPASWYRTSYPSMTSNRT